MAMRNGGEVTGQRSAVPLEPTPYGMIEIKRGYLKVGLTENDSLWGLPLSQRDISVDGFWMDQSEVTNSMYRQFVEWVRDSILRERLADPSYGGDETYKIEVDKFGDPVKPHLNWNKPLPWRKPSEDQERALNSVYKTHPLRRHAHARREANELPLRDFRLRKGGTPQISSRSPRTRAQH